MSTLLKKKKAGAPAVRSFAATLLRLARKRPEKVDACFCCVEDRGTINGSTTTMRCHVLKQDVRGNIRVDNLVECLSQAVLDYAIPRSRIREARETLVKTGSSDAFVTLHEEARSLFTPVKKSGEGGELLLFWMTENVLGMPQILCKMPLKTNSNLHYNGVDGVHAITSANNTLAIVWGESKLYTKVKKAIEDCFDSIAPFLNPVEGSGVPTRDLELLRDNIDLDDPLHEDFLKRYLDRTNSLSLGLTYRAVCLIGFDHTPYPSAGHQPDIEAIRMALTQSMEQWKKLLSDAIANRNLGTFDIDVFLVPFPSVDDFRERLRKKIRIAS